MFIVSCSCHVLFHCHTIDPGALISSVDILLNRFDFAQFVFLVFGWVGADLLNFKVLEPVQSYAISHVMICFVM